MYWNGSTWTSTTSSTCFNLCQNFVTPASDTAWISCSGSCSNPSSDASYCSSANECKTWASATTSWSGSSSSHCINQCIGYTPNFWSPCTVVNCGPSSSGTFCSASTQCKTYDASINNWVATPISNTCSGHCHIYVPLALPAACTMNTCINNPGYGYWCVSRTTCRLM